ncbi:MAG: AAA family ATPase [Deltaproteobacteria bacterium]|nr:AAA family ATPase [Deltaproteobacteria bacterium]
MYEDFYGFKTKPFQLLPDPRLFFKSKKHEAALTYLEYGIYERTGFVLITGEVGTGKTTLLNYLLESLRKRKDVQIAFLSQTYLTPEEFLRTLCQEFSLPHHGRTKPELIEIFGNFLIREYRLKRYVILIIDEAQNLPFETLEEIRMLSNLNAGAEHLLQIILVGQPTLRQKLQKDTLRQLAQRIEVSYHLEPLDMEETKEYIKFRLEKAGGPRDIFTEEAIEEIYNYSKGIPRLINGVCNMCLVYGMADDIKKIDKDVVMSVLKDRTDWGISEGKEETKDVHVPAQSGVNGISGILSSIDSKLDVIVRVAEFYKSAMEEVLERIGKREEEKQEKVTSSINEQLNVESIRKENRRDSFSLTKVLLIVFFLAVVIFGLIYTLKLVWVSVP